MSIKQLLSQVAGGWVKAKNEQFTAGHPIAKLLRGDLVKVIKSILDSKNDYLVEASAGRGRWADVPWLSILNPALTESTQSGIYPVYLFRSDGSGVYLSLGFGTTDLRERFGTAEAKQKAEELRKNIRSSDLRLQSWDEEIDLRSNTPLGQSYEWASAGAKFYPLENMPSDKILLADLMEMLEIYSNVNSQAKKETFNTEVQVSMLSKPFLLLAGISGTGKSRFVREQAKQSSGNDEPSNYALISVRPDWHEPSDLLGYVSRLGENAPHFVSTPTLKFMVSAWKNINPTAEELSANRFHDKSDVLPYWLCLDEMNLAPVEQYFADYLSVIETREWTEDGYRCDSILKADVIKGLSDKGRDALKKDLGLEVGFDGLWNYFCSKGVPIPYNLMVAGTVNMDETTHGFSRKVIDRALSFDFGAFFPNHYDEFFTPTSRNKRLSYPIWSQASKEDLATTYDADGSQTVTFLTNVNNVLKSTPFELAYRALNELLLAVVSSQPQDELTLKAVWDDFMMCKVLPRIEGDSDKLTTADGKEVLVELNAVLAIQLASIWQTDQRPDLYREKSEGETDADKVLHITCRSKAKLKWMSDRLASATFTSFWP